MTTNEVCPDCQGGGYRDKIPLQNCPTCNGVGWMKAVAGMDALDRLSTPPAVPATPVAWLNPAEIRSLARKYAGDGEAAMDDQDQLDDKHLALAEVFERAFTAIIAAAPVPAHSDVRGSERDSIQEA